MIWCKRDADVTVVGLSTVDEKPNGGGDKYEDWESSGQEIVGSALGEAWARSGHEVAFGVRDPAAPKMASLLEKVVGTSRATSLAGAARDAEAVVLATPWPATENAIRAAGDLSGKVLFDCTNPLKADLSGLSIGHQTSGPEEIAAWAPGGTSPQGIQQYRCQQPGEPNDEGQAATMFYRGDDAEAKKAAHRLAAEIGFDPVAAGPLANARLLEPLARLWRFMAYAGGQGREIAFKLLHRQHAGIKPGGLRMGYPGVATPRQLRHNDSMANEPWHRNTLVLILACILLPPLGLVVFWMRRGTGILTRLAVSLGLLALTAVHLFMFYGLRVEMAGTGMSPIFTFGDTESHYERIERSRSTSGAVHAAATSGSIYWTDYRGPHRDGHYQQTSIRIDWPAQGLPELWRQPIGGGYASMVAAEGRVFTIEQRRDHEVAAAYDLQTGRELWVHSWAAFFQESLGGDGPRATPTWHEGRLYVLGAQGNLFCLNAATGEVHWEKNILEDNGAKNLTWGMSAAPLIVDDKVIVLPGGRGGKSVVAYHKETGEPVWSAFDDNQAYTSPALVELAGQRQILIVSAARMMGIRAEDGGLLWDYPWTTSYDVNAAQPVIVDESHVLISAGYGHGAALVKVTETDDGFRAEEVWKNINLKNKFSSSVIHEGLVYGLDENILSCLDPRTGERKWKGGRYGYGQVLLADGHVIVLTEQGDVVLVKATPDSHQEVARFSALSGKTWNVPAISDGKLLVRNQTEMACYDLAAS